jgi:pimeloyl-ACP methyl ester carboxylesterase
MKRRTGTILAAAVLAMSCVAAPTQAYDFPIENRYAATVIGTPEEFAYPLPEKFPFDVRTLKNDKAVPDVLWYERGLKFGVASHRGERRPLVFVIAGTGASFRSAKARSMAKALYTAGNHVITLTSPTHLNFLVNASTTHLPGYPQDDTLDLYRVMEQAYADVRDKVDVSEFHVTGYSLGGMQAAFASFLDEERGSFNFSKVLMINPPVDLFNSVNILDEMLVESIPGGVDGVPVFLDQTIDHLAALHSDDQELRFDGNFLYYAYDRLLAEREAAGLPNDGKGARGLIGIAFRLSSAGMVFGADVMNDTGYIVSRGIDLSKYDSLTRYSRISHRVTFQEYVDDLLIPGLLARKPGMTREKLLADASLHAIADYLRSSEKISAVTNEDEIILAPNELGYLKTLLGDRLKTYPLGGHCGNMEYQDNVEYMIEFFRN